MFFFVVIQFQSSGGRTLHYIFKYLPPFNEKVHVHIEKINHAACIDFETQKSSGWLDSNAA